MGSTASGQRGPRAVWRRVLTLSARGQASPSHETGDQKLARLARWVLDGRRRDAVAALRQWRDAPLAGQNMLALLTGRVPPARHMLGAARRSRRGGARSRGASSPARSVRLAEELACREHLLPSLVAALRLEPRPAMVGLLRRAVDRLASGRRRRELDARLCLAAAELALLDEDRAMARRWAMRVCRIDPGNALAAKLLLRTADNPRRQRLAHAALAASLAAHPEYRDLQALARRMVTTGRRAA